MHLGARCMYIKRNYKKELRCCLSFLRFRFVKYSEKLLSRSYGIAKSCASNLDTSKLPGIRRTNESQIFITYRGAFI